MDTSLHELLVGAGLRFVSFRPRSEKEIRIFFATKLKRWKTAGDESVNRAMLRLQELGYVDDHKFAAWWIEQRSTFRPKGVRALSQELQNKGVSREIIDEALRRVSTNDSPMNELTVAKVAIQKKRNTWERLPIIEYKKKLYAYLAQRGFSSETIHRVIDEMEQNNYNR